MFDTLVVPLDGSPTAEGILPVLRQVFAPYRGDAPTLALVHVVAFEAVAFNDLPGLGGVRYDQLLEALQEEGQRYLSRQAEALTETGYRVETQAITGVPLDAIIDAATSAGDGAAIAMASHGRSGASRWLLGSVAERVLRAAPCPLLLVHPTEDDPPPPSRILVAIDGSHRALAIVPHAAELARRHAAAVELLAVIEAGDQAWADRAEGYLDEASAAFAEQGVETSKALRTGEAESVIVEHAKASGAGLIALATHGRTGLSRLLLGSVTESVLRHTGVPMLIVRAAS